MSASPPIADMLRVGINVRLVPEADIRIRLPNPSQPCLTDRRSLLVAARAPAEADAHCCALLRKKPGYFFSEHL